MSVGASLERRLAVWTGRKEEGQDEGRPATTHFHGRFESSCYDPVICWARKTMEEWAIPPRLSLLCIPSLWQERVVFTTVKQKGRGMRIVDSKQIRWNVYFLGGSLTAAAAACSIQNVVCLALAAVYLRVVITTITLYFSFSCQRDLFKRETDRD